MKQFEVKMKCTIYKTAIFECETIEEVKESFLEEAVRVTESEMTPWEILSVEESK